MNENDILLKESIKMDILYGTNLVSYLKEFRRYYKTPLSNMIRNTISNPLRTVNLIPL